MIKKIFVFVLLIVSIKASPCGSEYNCTTIPDNETPKLLNLNCTLPNMPQMRIIAEDVFDGKNLKTYWNGKTVCDVLGWMNKGAERNRT